MAGPALSHRRRADRARLVHDLRHQGHSLIVRRHSSLPVDAEAAALGAATSGASTLTVAINPRLWVLARAWLSSLCFAWLLLLLPLLSGQILTAEILAVRVALLAGLLLDTRVAAIILVLGSVVHVLLRCSHLLRPHSGLQRVTQPCPIGSSMNKRHEQAAVLKGVQCMSNRSKPWNARGTRISLTSSVSSPIGAWHSTLAPCLLSAFAMKLTPLSGSRVTSTSEIRTECARHGWAPSKSGLRLDPVSAGTPAQRRSRPYAGHDSPALSNAPPAQLHHSLPASADHSARGRWT